VGKARPINRLKINMNRPPGFFSFQDLQGGLDDRELPFRIARPVEGISVGKRHKERSGRPHPFDHFAKKLYGDRGDSLPLQFRRHQTHGLVTHRSDRYKEGDINAVLNQLPGGPWGGIPDQAAWGGDRSHEGKMALVDRSDPSSLFQFPHTVDRKGEIRIQADAGMVKGVAPV